jgi:hypothetical protein
MTTPVQHGRSAHEQMLEGCVHADFAGIVFDIFRIIACRA